MVSPRTFWVGMIVGLLSLSVGVNLAVLFIFAKKPQLEENWEAKAENWDVLQRQHSVNKRLGWKLSLGAAEAQVSGPVTFQLTLKDDQGERIPGAGITLRTSHNAHYDERQDAIVSETQPGHYRFEMAMPYEGYWQFTGEAVLPGKTESEASTTFTQVWMKKLERPSQRP